MKARDGNLPDLKLHPLCAAWPEMTAEQFADLKADIAKRGVYDPVIVLDGMILDGQNRWRAARELGIPAPMTREYTGESPAAFVIGKNARRRHMPKAEVARAVARCLDWRPRQGGRPSQKKPCQVGKVSNADMAKAAGVGERTMSRAKHDVRVERGEIPATPKPKPASTPKPKRERVPDAGELRELRAKCEHLSKAISQVTVENDTLKVKAAAFDALARKIKDDEPVTLGGIAGGERVKVLKLDDGAKLKRIVVALENLTSTFGTKLTFAQSLHKNEMRERRRAEGAVRTLKRMLKAARYEPRTAKEKEAFEFKREKTFHPGA